jgi:hypothetical protein
MSGALDNMKKLSGGEKLPSKFIFDYLKNCWGLGLLRFQGIIPTFEEMESLPDQIQAKRISLQLLLPYQAYLLLYVRVVCFYFWLEFEFKFPYSQIPTLLLKIPRPKHFKKFIKSPSLMPYSLKIQN